MKLKEKPATPANKRINPFSQEPCIFTAKLATETIRALVKMKEALNQAAQDKENALPKANLAYKTKGEESSGVIQTIDNLVNDVEKENQMMKLEDADESVCFAIHQ